MYETVDELACLRDLLDSSLAQAGPHLRDIITDETRLSAEEVCRELQGMRLLVLGTTTRDGRPLVGPVDGYFLHGSFFFSSGRNAVRMKHLATRPSVSASYLPNERWAITVHGRASLFDLADPSHGELRQAMLDHYLPRSGEAFREWLDGSDALGARIDASKMFTFSMPSESGRPESE